MTVLPRAATANELAYLRSDNQSTRLYLTTHQPAILYTARLAAVPASTDSVAAITYNSGSGIYTSILQDMTMLVGSTPGGFDLGQVRIRNTSGIGATSGTFNIGEESEVNWQSGAYLTVLDEFVPWARHLRTSGTTVYMDYDIAYTDQHSKCDSVPIMGPPRVAWLRAPTVTLSFDVSQSWALNNTITSYASVFNGAVSTTGLTTTTPTATFNATGTYRWDCSITNSDGKTFVGHRYIFIVDETSAIDQFTCGSVRGDYQTGGWSFDVTLYDQADRATVRDRALVILHAVDYYGDTPVSLGYVAGSENIRAIGWVAGDSIAWKSEEKNGSVTFSVEGLHYWLNKMSAFPEGLKDVTAAPVKWTKFQSLSCKAVAWHMLHWRTTLTRCTDIFPCEDTQRAARIEAPGAQTLWQQLNTMLDQAIFANPHCDRYGRLFLQVEQQLLNSTEKASIPSVMTLTKFDWTGQIDIERTPMPECGLADFGGVAFDGTNAVPYLSLSPGHVFKQYGTPETRERLIFGTQAIANQRCGAFVGWKNNNYKQVTIELSANNKMFDITPYQWATVDITTADTVREIDLTGLRLIPRVIEDIYSNGYLHTRMQFEAESIAEISITNTRPPIVVTPIEIAPVLPPPPLPTPTPTASGKEVWMWHYNAGATPSNAIIYSTDYFSNPSAPTYNLVATLPADLAFITSGSITIDGALCFIVGHSLAGHTEIWECANPKAGSPTWTKTISYGGSPGFGGSLENVIGFDEASNGYSALVEISTSVNPIVANESTSNGLKFNRGVTRHNPDGSSTIPPALWHPFNGLNSVATVLTNPLAKAGGFGYQNLAGGFGYSWLPDTSSWLTRTTPNLGTPFYRGMYAATDFSFVRNQQSPSAPWQTVKTFPYNDPIQYIGGSFFGTTVYMLASHTSGTRDSNLYYSLNGVDFNLSSDQFWTQGKVLSANLSGGKYALWFIADPWYQSGIGHDVINSNEFLRYSVDVSDIANNPWTSSTGNLWSLITAGNLTLKNVGIVYG